MYVQNKTIAVTQHKISATGVAQTTPLTESMKVGSKNISGISNIPFLNRDKIRLLQAFPTAWKNEIDV